VSEAESITCPQCGMTSHNPTDIKFGYCGNCHEYTGVDRTQVAAVSHLACGECGFTSPFHEKNCRLLLESRERVVEDLGEEVHAHPSMRNAGQILVQPRERHDEPRPGDRDYADWCHLFETLTFTPELALDMSFSQRRAIALHLWRHGYRRPVTG